MSSPLDKKTAFIKSKKRQARSKCECQHGHQVMSSNGELDEFAGAIDRNSIEARKRHLVAPSAKQVLGNDELEDSEGSDVPWLRLKNRGESQFGVEEQCPLSEDEGEDRFNFEVIQAAAKIAVDSSDEGSDDSEGDGQGDRKRYEMMESKSKKLDEYLSTLREGQSASEEDEDAIEKLEDQVMFDFPSDEILVKEKQLGVSFDIIKTRFEATILLLKNWSVIGKRVGRNRSEYVALFKNDLAYYFGYNEFLIDKIFDIFGPEEALEFVRSNEGNRPITIRVNSLKSRRVDLMKALKNRGVVLEPIEWNKYAIQIFESSIPIGATAEYLAGHYMLQSASSLTAVMILNPQMNERILDMCSAPGGKATYIAQLMKNTGTLVVNDFNKSRIPSLVANLHRLKITNSIVCNYDGTELPGLMKGFDRVLLDAPCSGTGIISRDQSVKTTKSQADLMKLGDMQRKLLLAAIDCVDIKKPNSGFIVYSTCSILIEENEVVIDYALKKRYVRVVDCEFEFGMPGLVNCRGKKLCDSIKLARRFYPHVYNMDGFFVCKLKKYKNGPRTTLNANTTTSTQLTTATKKPLKNITEEFVEIVLND